MLLGRRKTVESLPTLREQPSGSQRSQRNESALGQANSSHSGMLPGVRQGDPDRASDAPAAAAPSPTAVLERLECVVLNGCKTEATAALELRGY